MTRSTISSVLDALALLALLFREQGAERFVSLVAPRPAMSAVNWSEVRQKVTAHGVDGRQLLSRALDAGLEVMDLTVDRAERVADLWPVARPSASRWRTGPAWHWRWRCGNPRSLQIEAGAA